MIPVRVGIFVVLAVLLVATPSYGQNSRIDNIIEQGWLKAEARMEREGIRPSHAHRADKLEPAHNHKFTCGHAEMKRTHNIAEITERIRTSGRQPQQSAHHKRNAAAIGPLRIANDTSRMLAGADVGYACYNVGDRITTSWPPSTYTCQAGDILTAGNRTAILNDVLPTAITVISSLLMVPQSPTLFLDGVYYDNTGGQNCSLGIPIDPKLVLGKSGATGIPNADFFVYVTARPASSDSNLASAMSCNSVVKATSPAPLYGRPLAGHINFNPLGLSRIDLTDSFQFRRYVRVAVHEFFHSLGFTSDMFPHYVDDNGARYASPTLSFMRDGLSVKLLTTPRVQTFARRHYNCSDLEGFELEDGGGSGTAVSHWEMRIGQNELMTGLADTRPVITNLTLSLFKDTGWYEVNWTQAEPFVFGFRAQCTFARNKCNTWNLPSTFCDKPYLPNRATMCNYDRSAVSYCDLQTNVANIPSQFQYFTNPLYGSPNSLKDYCPTWTGFSNGYCESSNYLAQRPQEKSGDPASRCFDLDAGAVGQVGCFLHRCSSGYLEVQINGAWVACPTGQSIPYTGTSFSIKCAPELCISFSSSIDGYVPLPPSTSGGNAPSVAVVPVSAAPSGSYLYFWTNDLLQFGLVIGAIVLAAIIIIALIAVCIRRKK